MRPALAETAAAAIANGWPWQKAAETISVQIALAIVLEQKNEPRVAGDDLYWPKSDRMPRYESRHEKYEVMWMRDWERRVCNRSFGAMSEVAKAKELKVASHGVRYAASSVLRAPSSK